MIFTGSSGFNGDVIVSFALFLLIVVLSVGWQIMETNENLAQFGWSLESLLENAWSLSTWIHAMFLCPLACVTSPEALFALIVMYLVHRPLEVHIGTRRFFSFILVSHLLSFLFQLLLLITFDMKVFSLRPGPFALVFAGLARYHVEIPALYQFQLGTSNRSRFKFWISDKAWPFFFALQMLCVSSGQPSPRDITLFSGLFSLNAALPAFSGFIIGIIMSRTKYLFNFPA